MVWIVLFKNSNLSKNCNSDQYMVEISMIVGFWRCIILSYWIFELVVSSLRVYNKRLWTQYETWFLWAWAAIVNFRDVDDALDQHQADRPLMSDVWYQWPVQLGDRTSADPHASPPSRNSRQVSRDSPAATHVDMCCIMMVHVWTSAYLCLFLLSSFMLILLMNCDFF